MQYPKKINNSISNKESKPISGLYHPKINPHNSEIICHSARSDKRDVDKAVLAAKQAQKIWAETPPVKRGDILFNIAQKMEEKQEQIAEIIHLETGKSKKDAFGEAGGAIALAKFFAGEGQRLYARTATSAAPNKYAMTVREPVGVTGLIISANTPIANIAWKVFPALICGNAAILKASEDSPIIAWLFGNICVESGLPDGVLSIIYGKGTEAGAAIVEHPEINLISFTGSTAVGKYIAETAGKRLAKISLELGGKNPLVVCEDADLDNAIKWSLLSAFSNAGQRCAAASRIIVFEEVYEKFKNRFVKEAKELKIGPNDADDLGPVINEKQLNNMLATIKEAAQAGAKILCGGKRMADPDHKNGCYLEPTVIENAKPNDMISNHELFGPVVCLYRVNNYTEALQLANNSPYGLTACIHTKNVHRALDFTRKVESGVAMINGGTYGSEPHMPFGGVKNSGNGTREPGTEALDVYSNIKDIYQIIEPELL